MNPADEVAAKPDAAGSDKKSDQKLHTLLENLGRVAHQDDLHSGFTPYLHLEALERKAIYDRLVAIENQMKRRGSGWFTRSLVAILIGVAAPLAWQSYGENSPVRPSAFETPQAATVIAPENVAPIAPAAPSLDPEQVHHLALDVAALRQTADQIAAGQDEVKRAIVKLASGVVEVLVRLPAPLPPQPPAAPARKPTPTAPPPARGQIPPRVPSHP